MNKYEKPEMKIEKFDISDVITVSGETIKTLDAWGTQVKVVDAVDVADFN